MRLCKTLYIGNVYTHRYTSGSYIDLSTQEFIVNNELTNSHLFALAILFDITKKPLCKNPLPFELDQTLVKPKERFTSVGNTSNQTLGLDFTSVGITDPSERKMFTE